MTDKDENKIKKGGESTRSLKAHEFAEYLEKKRQASKGMARAETAWLSRINLAKGKQFDRVMELSDILQKFEKETEDNE